MDERLYIEDFDGFVMRKSRVVFLRDHGIEPIIDGIKMVSILFVPTAARRWTEKRRTNDDDYT